MKSLDYKFDFRDAIKLSLVMDFYELTMSQCYFNSDHRDRIVTFDLFYRKNPDNGGYAVFAGLEEIIGYIQNLHFEDEDIEYLRSLHKFSEEFLDYLRHFIFTGDVYAVKVRKISPACSSSWVPATVRPFTPVSLTLTRMCC